MKKMLVTWILLMTLMSGTLLYIGYQIKTTDGPYMALEKNLEEAAYGYIKINDLSLSFNEKIRINLDTLVDQNLIKTTSVDDDPCEGYVIAKKGVGGVDYEAYIKCTNYSSANYGKN